MASLQATKHESSPTQPSLWKPAIFGSVIAGGFVLYNMWQKYRNIPSKQWLRECPKIELHAHLHGSIRMQTLADLYQQAANDENLKHVIKADENPQQKIEQILKEHKSFNEVFALFDVIHRVVCSKQVLVRIINEVLLDFARQNVKYLELRSTPRALAHSGHSRADYVDIILEEIRKFPVQNPRYSDMIIRFLVTIQNGKPIQEARESLDIIQKYLDEKPDAEQLIVGIDFAPRPIKNKTFKYYEGVLQRARSMGLKITVHFAEYYDRCEQDLVLHFKPDRLGHAVNLQHEDYSFLLQHPIPIEICPTSNIFTKSIEDYTQHPFKYLIVRHKKRYRALYPLLICTDDFGVFETDLANEWSCICNAHHLSKYDVRNITMNAIEFIFATQETKQKLKAQMQDAWQL